MIATEYELALDLTDLEAAILRRAKHDIAGLPGLVLASTVLARGVSIVRRGYCRTHIVVVPIRWI